MSRTQANKNASTLAGVILMAITAVALGYWLGNWAIGLVTGPDMNPVSTEPLQQDIQVNTGIGDASVVTPVTDVTNPETRMTPSTQQIQGIFTVQLGAFGSRANAERLCNELIDKGYQATVTEEAGLHKVQLYGSQSKEEAERLKNDMKTDGYVDVFIVHN